MIMMMIMKIVMMMIKIYAYVGYDNTNFLTYNT